MSKPTIDFYFDFSSPYGYLAAQRIDEIAEKHGREAVWRPHLIGAAFKTTGSRPLRDIPMKWEYAKVDAARAARLLGVPITMPPRFPFLSVAASRAYYWTFDRDPAAAKALAKALYRAAFGEGRDISTVGSVVAIAGEIGQDSDALADAFETPAIKERLRDEVDAALDRGVYGSPFVFVGDEPFWGFDHLELVDRWLETGGW